MKVYLSPPGAGPLVNVIYGMFRGRALALRAVALVGLFAILIGEQIAPDAMCRFAGRDAATWVKTECAEYALGTLLDTCGRDAA